MPSPPKIFFNGSVHFVTTTVEEGLMFPNNPLVIEIIKKCIARAQELHPVHISDFLFNTTHLHLFMQVIDPSDMADFMERFKCESSAAINRLLGRKKRTVWCEGYDSPLIVDMNTAIDKIAYIYSNPSKDYLTDTVEKYPGISTFEQRERSTRKGAFVKEYEARRIRRTDIKPLPKKEGGYTLKDYKRLRRELIYNKEKTSYEINMNCWMPRFGACTKAEQRAVSRQIVEEVRIREAHYRAVREEEGREVMGRTKLQNQQIGAPYSRNVEGYRMMVHCLDKDLRKETINWIKALREKAREVLERWRQGDTTCPYPMGLFPPTGIRLVEPIGW